jgi:predicted nucleic acid-binding protein
MNGNKIFVDTNIILYLLSGDKTLAELLDGKQLYVSFITQLELLGYPGLTKKNQKIIEDFLNQCIIVDINAEIKEFTLKIKRAIPVKLPDAIIMASALYMDLPIITADEDFKKIEEIDIIFYQRNK